MQAAKLPSSSLHSKLATPVPASVPLKVNDAELVALGFDGLLSIVVSGTAVSIVQVNDAGVGSTLPAPSIARTWKEWLPSERPAYSFGLVHAAKPASSSLHSKLATPVPASVPLKLNDAEPELVGSPGLASIVVAGEDVSIVHVNDAGVGSTLPTPSIARTWNVWLPSSRPE